MAVFIYSNKRTCKKYMVIIYAANTGSEMPAQQLIRSVNHGDKVAHFTLFGALSFLAVFEEGSHNHPSSVRTKVTSVTHRAVCSST